VSENVAVISAEPVAVDVTGMHRHRSPRGSGQALRPLTEYARWQEERMRVVAGSRVPAVPRTDPGMHSASVSWRTTKPKQPLVPPVPALRYALGVATVRFQKARHGPQVSSSKTASNGTVRSRVPTPPVQASTCRFATSTTRCTIGALTPRTDGSRVPTVTFTRRSRQRRWRPLLRARRPAPRRPGCRPGPDWVVDRCAPTTAAPPAEDTALRSSRQADGWRST
jgi:hypothetical protein